MKRGDVYYADLRPVIGSEQGGIRPVVIVQNDIGNLHSPTIIVAAVTSKLNKAKLPTHIELSADRYHMVRDSVILLEQLRTIDKFVIWTAKAWDRLIKALKSVWNCIHRQLIDERMTK